MIGFTLRDADPFLTVSCGSHLVSPGRPGWEMMDG